LSDKLVRRHPHVFGALAVTGSDDVLRNWEAIKRTEKDASRSALDGVPRALPALSRAQRLQTKASRVGFDWPDATGPQTKIAEELLELAAATADGDRMAIRHEAGDLLFSVVNLCRFLKIDAEEALQEADSRFARRFRDVERRVLAEGKNLRDCPMQDLDAHWEAVKASEG
jgi:MazG family protein